MTSETMTPLRVVDTCLKPARWNIAVTAALTELHRARSMPDTVRFHRYPRSVLIGRHQELAQEVDVGLCRKGRVEIARRVTGGGAVYMSPSILAWDIVAGRHRFGAGLEEVSLRIGSTIAAGLRRLGLAAELKAPGSIEINGWKVSGSSGGFEGPTMIMQGTILIDFDRAEMAGLLKARPGAPAPVTRVARLSDFLGRVPSIEEVQSALMAELSGAFGVSNAIEDLRLGELAFAEKILADEIGTDEFVTGQFIGAAALAPETQPQAEKVAP